MSAITTDATEADEIETTTGDEPRLSERELKLEGLVREYEEKNGIIHEHEDVPDKLTDPEPIQTDGNDPFMILEDGKRALKLKINGQEVIEPLDKAIVELQKLGSADARLREAAAERAALQDYQRRLEAEAAALENTKALYLQQQNQQPAPVAKRQINPDQVKAFTEAVFNGEETANDKLMELLNNFAEVPSQPTNPAVDPVQIAEVAAAQALVKMQAQREQERYIESIERGKEWLSTTYPEVNSDPMLFDIINAHTNKVSAENPNYTPELVIKTATEAVMLKFGKQTVSAPTRADTKSTLQKPIKTLSSTPVASDDVANVEETPQQVAESLRRIRSGFRNY